MTTRRDSDGDGRRLTLTERARRAQLIDATIDQIAEKGYAGTSLAAIAAAAGITKAAVLYHFASKDVLVDAAREHVLAALVTEVATAVEAVGPSDGPAVYIRSMIGHLREHPRHTRTLIEAMSHGAASHAPEERWRPLAQIIDAAAAARGSAKIDSRTLAIIIGGGIDAIVSERLRDPVYDMMDAAEQLAEIVNVALAR